MCQAQCPPFHSCSRGCWWPRTPQPVAPALRTARISRITLLLRTKAGDKRCHKPLANVKKLNLFQFRQPHFRSCARTFQHKSPTKGHCGQIGDLVARQSNVQRPAGVVAPLAGQGRILLLQALKIGRDFGQEEVGRCAQTRQGDRQPRPAAGGRVQRHRAAGQQQRSIIRQNFCGASRPVYARCQYRAT